MVALYGEIKIFSSVVVIVVVAAAAAAVVVSTAAAVTDSLEDTKHQHYFHVDSYGLCCPLFIVTE